MIIVFVFWIEYYWELFGIGEFCLCLSWMLLDVLEDWYQVCYVVIVICLGVEEMFEVVFVEQVFVLWLSCLLGFWEWVGVCVVVQGVDGVWFVVGLEIYVEIGLFCVEDWMV